MFRIQSVPVFKEVKVQLLDHEFPDQRSSSKSAPSKVESATTIAAATAAAIASTAPLLKVNERLVRVELHPSSTEGCLHVLLMETEGKPLFREKPGLYDRSELRR